MFKDSWATVLPCCQQYYMMICGSIEVPRYSPEKNSWANVLPSRMGLLLPGPSATGASPWWGSPDAPAFPCSSAILPTPPKKGTSSTCTHRNAVVSLRAMTMGCQTCAASHIALQSLHSVADVAPKAPLKGANTLIVWWADACSCAAWQIELQSGSRLCGPGS